MHYCIYMTKKYLLYIHDPRFSQEKKKSDLVNDLLTRYYGDNALEQVTADHQANAKIDLTKVIINNPKQAEKALESAKPVKIVAKGSSEQKTCKNDHPIPLGRDRCLGKGCKYA